MAFHAIGIFATLGTLIATLRFIFRKQVPKGLKLPPGPPGHLLLGNLRDIPSGNEWETYAKWHEKYGDLVYLNVLGNSLLYVNSPEMAYELFEKRSAIYSDRPHIPMVDLTGWSWSFALMQYGERWRKHRQMFHRMLSSTKLDQHLSVQVKRARLLLQHLYNSSDEWRPHIAHSTGATIMEIAYGINVLPENDPYIARGKLAVGVVGIVSAPGAYLVNTIPILRHLPDWFPGAGFKKQAKAWKKATLDMITLPLDLVKERLAAGTAKPSIATTLLEEAYAVAEDQKISQEDEELIRNLSGVIFAAGADTTSSTLEIFILAMLLYPETQSAAQKELDAVIGPERLPSFDDRSNLPYISALCKEVLRWHPLGTTALPHRLMQDDIVDSYYIPAGTMVLGNAWGILHSEAAYGPDTMLFKPERFLHSPDMMDPAAAFGFGRRACPGRPMAENSLFITVASILHVFNIALPVGASSPRRTRPEFVAGLLSPPVPFQCTFVPRSKAAVTLIKELQ